MLVLYLLPLNTYNTNIMKTEVLSARIIEKLLYKQKIATMAELKAVLGTQVDMTAYRKLKELSYLKSYSNNGKYYTLDGIPTFDQQGLWCYKSVFFSRFGTLLNTLEQIINTSGSGYFEPELERLLKVSVRASLLKLISEQRIQREKLSGCYLYCSPIPEISMNQFYYRNEMLEENKFANTEAVGRECLHHELKAAIILFYSLLDEKQRRLYAGLESLMCGYGGDRKIADLLGLDEHTIGRGRKEVLQRDIETERIRRVGGGRKSSEKKHPKSSPPSKR